MDVKQVAAVLGLQPWTVYAWCREGKLPCVRLGRTVKVDPVRLRQWIADHECTVEPSPAA
jgi:excisionase family DNA binding protein